MNAIKRVRSQRDAILVLAAKYGARRVRLFGSVARGEAGAASDLDVLVDFEPGRSLLDQVGFEQDLEDLLGCPVDVVVEGGISPYLEATILREAVPL
jgi:predicted nucleotidyltransferase